MKKKIAAGAVLAICLSMLIYTTIAYFNTADTARNVITTGNIDIELQETTADGKEFTNVVNVMPGQEVSKIVRIYNKGANDAYVRISLNQFIELASGEIQPDTSDLIFLDIDTQNWTAKDGFYYYDKPLAPGETTEPLFKTVTFAAGMGNEYQGSEATIEVTAQATQVKNNGGSVFDAAGWPDTDKTDK